MLYLRSGSRMNYLNGDEFYNKNHGEKNHAVCLLVVIGIVVGFCSGPS